MVPVLLSSLAFGVGGMFMKPSDGLTRLAPSMAVSRGSLSSLYIVGLGFEALVSVALGVFVLGERMTVHQLAGVGLIVAGVCAMRWT
jgi:multidrug transporter EmrE-like cation transporter